MLSEEPATIAICSASGSSVTEAGSQRRWLRWLPCELVEKQVRHHDDAPHIGVKGGILAGFRGKTIICGGLVHDLNRGWSIYATQPAEAVNSRYSL